MSISVVVRVGVVLATSDVQRLVDFYVSRLGFVEEESFADPPYVTLTRSGTRLSIAESGHSAPDFPNHVLAVPHDRRPPSWMLVLEVPDCDVIRATLAGSGVEMASDTFRPDWGGARFFIKDPDGNVIEVEQPADAIVGERGGAA